jgi:hypothetical protein
MNDPGLDEPISSDAKDVENQRNDEKDERQEDEQAFLNPRYYSTINYEEGSADQSIQADGGLQVQLFLLLLAPLVLWHRHSLFALWSYIGECIFHQARLQLMEASWLMIHHGWF